MTKFHSACNAHTMKLAGLRLSYVLGSDKFSEDSKIAVKYILDVIVNESNVFIDHPEIIKIAYPILMESINFQYGKGLHQAIEAVIESGADEELDRELQQFHIRFSDSAQSSEPLDLSNLPEECQHLNTLANDLANVLNNPALPVHLRDCIGDELSNVYIETNTQKNILLNLKSLLDKEKEID